MAVMSDDPILSGIGAVGLAAAAGTALSIDLDTARPLAWSPGRTLADVAAEGPTHSELLPQRSGIALLSGGGIGPDEAREAIDLLASRWPAVVLRVSQRIALRTVPILGLYPGWGAPAHRGPAVWQRVPSGPTSAPGPGPVLPCLGTWSLRRLLLGSTPLGSRWASAWREVWSLPWD